MAKLTSSKRNSLPTSVFAIPSKRKYPIHDASHARDALARVSGNGTPAEVAQVKRAVKKKYPSMKVS